MGGEGRRQRVRGKSGEGNERKGTQGVSTVGQDKASTVKKKTEIMWMGKRGQHKKGKRKIE